MRRLINSWAKAVLSLGVFFATSFACNKSAFGQVGQAGTTNQGQRSALEESLVKEAIDYHRLEIEPHPEGKIVEEIKIYVAEVLDDRDPIPNFLNVFHVKTRDFILRQEVLQPLGRPWDVGRVLETERNLRNLRQISVANVVATKGSSAASVILLVVVKDVWSLRLNSDIRYSSAGLDYLLLNPAEENLAGVRANLGAYFLLERERYGIGGSLGYPRLPATRYSVALSGGVYRNRQTEKAEGSFGGIAFSLPQYSRYSKWAYGADMSFSFDIFRQYQNGVLVQTHVKNADGQVETIPLRYHSDRLSGTYYGIRSFGVAHKRDLEFGLAINMNRYRPLEQDVTLVSPEALAVFEKESLPVSDTRVRPYLSLSAYETRFFRGINVESLGLQEDHRLGYAFVTSLFVGSETFGSTRDFVGATASLGYTKALGSGLVRIGAASRVVVANQGRHEGYFTSSARIVSPSFGVGRLHLDGFFGYRYEDYLNVNEFRMGVNNRLRGYPPNWDAFHGTNAVFFNAECRTKGVDFLSAQVGLAAFFDMGAVTNDLSSLTLRQAAGAGIRVVFPQAERTVLRFDWGVPLSGDVAPLPGAYVITFGQAFPMPNAAGGGGPFVE